MRRAHAQRGAAMLTTLLLGLVLMVVVGSLMLYSHKSRLNAIQISRSQDRVSCAWSGLQIARAFYGRNFAQWNQFLSQPQIFNPVRSESDPNAPRADPTSGTLRTTQPQLFGDVDGDGAPDVFIFIRDNADELLPAADNPAMDNDQNVIVGAVCVSSTLAPRRQDGTQDVDALMVEGLLSFNGPPFAYTAQNALGATGSGNLNGP